MLPLTSGCRTKRTRLTLERKVISYLQLQEKKKPHHDTNRDPKTQPRKKVNYKAEHGSALGDVLDRRSAEDFMALEHIADRRCAKKVTSAQVRASAAAEQDPAEPIAQRIEGELWCIVFLASMAAKRTISACLRAKMTGCILFPIVLRSYVP